MRYTVFTPLLFLLCFFFSIITVEISTFAASKTYVKTGEKLELSLQDTERKDKVSWIISKEGTIVETLTDKKFSYSFAEKGDYIIRCSVTNAEGEIQTSVVEVQVSNTLPNFSPLHSKITTVPKAENGVITLSGESKNITFSFQDSTGDITQYSFEADIFEDSDEDGIIDNDIDNKDSISYTTGGFYSHTYINTDIPSRAVLTVTNEEGETSTSAVTILFDDGEKQQENKQKPLQAVLKTLPESDDSGNINIPKSGGTVLIFAGDSTGKIKSYSIDTDTSFDSDNDGNPSNDIDNKESDSAKDGSVFPLEIKELKSSQSIAVTVTDSAGKTSTIQKTISPGENPQITASGNTLLVPLLFTSRTRVLQGESITLKLFNIAKNSKISWDFDGDGIFEIENGDMTEVEYKYAQEGTFNVKVEILESGDTPIVQRKTITVFDKNLGQIETLPPKAHFLPQVSGNKASFLSSKSEADKNLLNTDISYSWDFGDGYKSQGPNPVHVYETEGDYTVVLSVQDAIERTTTYSETVQIQAITEDFESAQHGGKTEGTEGEQEENQAAIPAENLPTPSPEPISDGNEPENGGTGENEENNSSGFSFPWWLLLILLILFSPLLFLLKKKIDSPDLSFSEIIHTIIHPDTENDDDQILEDLSQEIEKQNDESSEEDSNDNDEEDDENIADTDDEEDDSQERETTEELNEEVPDWMRNYEEEEETDNNNDDGSSSSSSSSEAVTETKSEENLSLEESSVVNAEEEILAEPAIAPLENTDGEVPDWMKVPLENTENVNTELEIPTPPAKSAEFSTASPFDIDHPEWLDEVKQGEENPEEILPETGDTETTDLDFSSDIISEDIINDTLEGAEIVNQSPVSAENSENLENQTLSDSSLNASLNTIEENLELGDIKPETPEIVFDPLLDSTEERDTIVETEDLYTPAVEQMEKMEQVEIETETEKKNILIKETPKNSDKLIEKNIQDSPQGSSEIFEEETDPVVIRSSDAKVPEENLPGAMPDWLK